MALLKRLKASFLLLIFYKKYDIIYIQNKGKVKIMIKFEKNNYITYFEDEENAAEWLIEEYENYGQFDIIREYYDDFIYWVNDNFSAYDILTSVPGDYTLENVREDWERYIKWNIRDGNYEEFTVEEEED